MSGPIITDRETQALALLGRAQPLNANCYALALGVRSLPIARRSLRKLEKLGVVRRWALAPTDPHLFTLRPAGRRHLQATLGLEDLRCPRSIGSPWTRAHHLRSVATLLCLRSSSQRTGIDQVQLHFEAQLRRAAGSAARIPDGIAVVGLGDNSVALVLETDLGTESTSVVAAKLTSYDELKQARETVCGTPTWRVLLTAPSRPRLNGLLRAAYTRSLTPGLIYFALDQDLAADNALSQPWQTLRSSAGFTEPVGESPLAGTTTWYNRRTRQRHASNRVTNDTQRKTRHDGSKGLSETKELHREGTHR